MAQLHPSNFSLSGLRNAEERRVINAFIEGLGPEWHIFPNLEFHELSRDREADVLLICEELGVLLIEVKGHPQEISEGQWRNSADRESADVQARGNSFAIRDFLRAHGGPRSIEVEWGVCLPKAISARGNLPPGIVREQLIFEADLDDVEQAVRRVLRHRAKGYRISPNEVASMVEALCPDVGIDYDLRAPERRRQAKLQALGAVQMRALKPMDKHRRVYVTGGAGTGKTYLAIEWAQRGIGSRPDGQPSRVLYTCYNDPLADSLIEQLGEDDYVLDGSVQIDAFLRIARRLAGMEPIIQPEDPDSSWFDEVLQGHLMKYWDQITERFDRIIVDEAQDFSPAWIGMLESLLDPKGENKMFLFADEDQDFFSRGFREPQIADGWVHIDLPTNIRNSLEIASFVEQLSHQEPIEGLPEGNNLKTAAINNVEQAIVEVRRALDELAASGYSLRETMVVTTDRTRETRNRLRESLGLCSWEERGGDRVVCETAKRVKGLELQAVIVVSTDEVDAVEETQLYVASTRAMGALRLVARPALLEHLGLKGS